MNSAYFLVLLVAGGSALIGGVLLVRSSDQRRRDARRVVVLLRFPRGLTKEQTLAVVRVVIGLAPAVTGFAGSGSVALEVVGTRRAVIHRLRLPASARAYFAAQLRAAVPGLAAEEVDETKTRVVTAAVELRRRLTAADLAVTDPATTSRTILAALTGLGRGETVIWQLVVRGGVAARPPEQPSLRQRFFGGAAAPVPRDGGVVRVVLRLGAVAATPKRTGELLARLRRAAASASAPGARLVPRLVPGRIAAGRLVRAATPITAAPVLLRPEELAALMGWPIGGPLVPGLALGGSPQLPPTPSVPSRGRVLGRASAGSRPVAQPLAGAVEHALILGPTGAGKSWLGARLFLADVAAGRGALLLDPKGGLATSVIERLPEEAIGRTIVVDPTDAERPVPLPLLAAEAGGIPELAADTLVALLRHRYRDLGPRSSDILSASLYALARVPEATLMNLLPLWSDAGFRSRVAARVSDDPVLAGFFAWFDGLGAAERNFILAAPLNKIRPLLQRPVVRNVLAAPRTTFTIAQALRERLVVIVRLAEGVLGSEATTLLGQVLLSRLWAATQARRGRSFYSVTIDEAPRFLDQPTDLGDMLARSREYGVGVTLIGQTLAQFPPALREAALANARTKVAFGTGAADARRLAETFGPDVRPDFFTGLGRFEAIGAVSLGGVVSPPFTFVTEALGPPVAGRARTVRAASRQRFGLPKTDIEASLRRATGGDQDGGHGPIGRRTT